MTPRYKVRLFQEKKILHNVEDPPKLDNEPLYPEVSKPNLVIHVVMDEHDEPILPPESISKSLPKQLVDYAL
jgi:hypothetical protein